MKARNILFAAALAALTLLSAGCKKQQQWRPEPGTLIRFRAESAPASQDAETKTSYSGAYFSVSGTRFERIDWVEGDMISIGYISAGGEDGFCVDKDHYKITSASVSSDAAYKSLATLAPVSGLYGAGGEGWGGNGLRWRNNTAHRFFATYPAVDFEDEEFRFEKNAAGDDIVVQVPYYYPPVQKVTNSGTKTVVFAGEDGNIELQSTVYAPDMKYAYMFANPADFYYGTTGSYFVPTESTINFAFYPHFTAFEFTAAAKEGDSFPLKGFVLSCADTERTDILSGMIYYTKVDGEENSWDNISKAGATSNTITVDFQEEITLTDSNPITFTVIARDNVDGYTYLRNLTLTFKVEIGGVTVNRSLKLSQYVDDGNGGTELVPMSFGKQLKHRIYGLRIPKDLIPDGWFEATDAGGYINQDW